MKPTLYNLVVNIVLSVTLHITVWTVVHTVLTAISQSNGNGQTLTTHRIQTPKPITIKLCTIDYVHETNTYFRFFGFFNKATAYTPGRIFTQIRQMTSFRVRKCLLGVLMTIFYIWTPKISEKPQFRGPILTGLGFFCGRNRFNMGML